MHRLFTPEALLGPLNEAEAKRAPRELFVAGDAALFEVLPRVAVVGTRTASPAGLKRAAKLSRMLAERGVTVVSGLAEGIDTAAHVAAMQAGGRTIAVIGTPLDQCYPRSNAVLQAEIATRHAVVSQFPSGYPISRKNFPMRNALMALIVSGSVIVEAGETSGALSQGWETLRLGRLLFIMDSVFHVPGLKWPQEMLEYGAQRLSDENFDAFLSALPLGKVSSDAIAF